MPQTKKHHNGELPLKFAEEVTMQVNAELEAGSLFEKVSPITRELLEFWNPNGAFAEVRAGPNFHKGQWQAILNTVYIHEVLKSKDVKDMYASISPELLTEMDFFSLKKEKHEHPKYCVKMATGTGKTWVMHALLIWQYLNARYEEEKSGRFSKNFLLVAPGLIVYERLLDAYLGKQKEDKTRDPETSDYKRFEDLFIPPAYRNEVMGFIQSNVVEKEDIGKKVTGEGMIIITNWHILSGEIEEREYISPLESPDVIVKKLLPKTPGTTAGHSLNILDNEYLRGRQVEFLSNLPDLVMINDEAHHLGGDNLKFIAEEKKWQNAIIEISKNKKDKFMQVDFSATPYTVNGSGQNRNKFFFPHIITNFELKEAIHLGLVKMVAIDKRKGEGAEELDFRLEKEDGVVKGLSSGQRMMIRAGLSKLKILESAFIDVDKTKYPKMLIVCQSIEAIPFVRNFLREEGLGEEEIMEIHSNKKGEVGQEEWKDIKQKLFNVDKLKNPRIIVSVLMLREGFDVNNICVIVPLRSSTSFILLEQVIGRGLRLMWRGNPEYDEMRQKNLINLLKKRIEPDSYIDLLYIIEHKEYEKFYETELSSDDIAEVTEDLNRERAMGDLINVSLKEDYQDYDLFWPIIIQDKEEELKPLELSLKNLEIYPIHLSELKKLFDSKGDKFVSKEITKETKFGEYEVTSEIFSAKSYNQFLQKMVNSVSSFKVKMGKRSNSQVNFYNMQINLAQVAKLTDEYIRHKLFNEEFDPLEGNNWRILLSTGARIVEHIRKNISKAIYEMQNSLDVKEAKISKRYFSENKNIKMRETYAIEVAKSIYPKLAYPSNKGGFEKAFMELIDADSKVERFIKIREYDYTFANIIYVREDGLLAHYFPDFIVKIGDEIYLVETKAERDLNNYNVKQKQRATIDWCNKINELPEEDRMNSIWHYALLGEKTFYSMSEKEASTKEILDYAKMTKSKINNTITRFFGEDDKY